MEGSRVREEMRGINTERTDRKSSSLRAELHGSQGILQCPAVLEPRLGTLQGIANRTLSGPHKREEEVEANVWHSILLQQRLRNCRGSRGGKSIPIWIYQILEL